MKKDLATAYAAKRKKVKGMDLDLEPRSSKANILSNEEMSEPVMLDDAMSDEEELTESGFLPESKMDNESGNNMLDDIMKKIRSKHMRG